MQSEGALRTIAKGAQSNIDSPRQAVARTQGEWDALWRAHDYDQPVPAVDFSRETVVAVFMGSRPSAGYTIAIVSAVQRGGALVVSYKESSPSRDAMTAQVLTSPFHIAAVPAFSGRVAFEKVEQ